MKRFPIYNIEHTDPAAFVTFWAAEYRPAHEELYDQYIGKPLTPEAIRSLFIWKNGSKLSQAKAASVQRNYIDRLDELYQLPSDTTAEAFLHQFANGGAIWRIFWLHCWQPHRFPIYDQHVHRAMSVICTGKIAEISSTKVIDSYISDYLPFHKNFTGLDWRMVDRGLWSYGKFIKSYRFAQQ